VPWPVYSTRFVVATAPDVWTNYTVPSGCVAVIKNLTGAYYGPNTGLVQLGAANQIIWLHAFPATNASVAQDFMIVARGLELVQVYCSSNVRAVVSGFLFRDAVLRGLVEREGEVSYSPPGPVPEDPRLD
jgi:hypothetical protein